MKDFNYKNYLKSNPLLKEEYKLGDKFSSDFDYDGMVEMGLRMSYDSDINDLQALYDSFEDVNYHSENMLLGMAIEAIKDNEPMEAQEFMNKFHVSLKNIMEEGKKDHDGDGDIDSDDYLAARDKAIKKAKGEANEEVTPEEEDKLKDIEGELNKASKMHKSQADRISKIVKEGGYKMKKSELKEFIKSTLNEDDINESVNDKTLNKIFKFFSRDLYGELKLDMGQAKKLTIEIEKLINKGL